MGTRSSTRPRLQREAVLDRAMEMADSDGLESVSIRKLAGELEVSPMALYWHFADKDALLTGISERLWNDVRAALPPAPSPDVDPRAGLRVITDALVAVLRAHPGCAPLAPLAVLTCEAGLDMTERSLALLAAGGVGRDNAASLAHFLLASAITLVSTLPGGLAESVDDEKHRAKKAALSALAPDRYPHLSASAAFFADCPDDEGYFRNAVDFLMGGLFSGEAATTGRGGRR